MAGRRFGRRVGRVRFHHRVFGKKLAGRRRSVNLVRGDVEKSKASFLLGRQVAPVRQRCLQQAKSADDIGLYEFTRGLNGAVDM